MRKNIKAWTLGLLFALGTVVQAAPAVKVFLTAKDGNQRLSEAGQLQWASLVQPSENQACVFVDPSKTFQTVLGIGGALTDASAETYDKLPQASREEIL
jgi:glucosylceramidase